MEKIKVGISSCLLGNEVRFDGQHKHDRYITETLGRWCDFVPVCPEVECGLSIPREAMRLVKDEGQIKLVTNKNFLDITPRMQTWAVKKLEELAKEDLVAFIFKTKSPSSGLRAVKVYKPDGNIADRNGTGMFADLFVNRFPEIPVEDEGRLHDPGLRENFIEKIFIIQRWKSAVINGRAADLVNFHKQHKYTLMAHSPEKLRTLGKITAGAGAHNFTEIKQMYYETLLQTISLKKTVKKNVNVLMHIMGYFKAELSGDEKKEILDILEKYSDGYLPVIVPITLLNHYVRKYEQPYLSEQWYLNPHPAELGLLNHV